MRYELQLVLILVDIPAQEITFEVVEREKEEEEEEEEEDRACNSLASGVVECKNEFLPKGESTGLHLSDLHVLQS